jgi:hypothetical protein
MALSEATLNPPSLEQINRDLAHTVAEEMQKNELLESAIRKAILQMDGCASDALPETLCKFCFGKVQQTLKESLAAVEAKP